MQAMKVVSPCIRSVQPGPVQRATLGVRQNRAFIVKIRHGVRCYNQAGGDEVAQAPTAPAVAPAAPPQYLPPQPYYVPVDASNTQPSAFPPPVPGQAPRQEYYYAAPPPGYLPYAPPAVAAEAPASSGLPWFVWLGLGVVLSKLFEVVQGIMKKGPGAFMTEMAMKQAMSAMASQQGVGASPFSAPPSGPFGAGGNPFAAPPGAGFGSAGFPPAASKTVDISPNPPATPGSGTFPSNTDKGDKFKQRLTAEGRAFTETPRKEQTAEGASGTKPLDVVEPVVKEPVGSSSNGRSTSTSSSFFTDVSDEEAAAASANASTSAGSGAGAGTAGGAADGEGGMMSQLMEQMLRNKEMQKMLYPYLPENLRNPESIEWMLNNPQVRKQMEEMFASQGVSVSPQMLEMMKGMDLNSDKVNQQFAELGLKPEDVVSKVMANPELAMGFQNPRVQQAIMDISQNPMNVVKYQNDPEVMKVLEKVNEIFAPQMR